MKKDYLKPRLEVVEVQLSDCIAGSVTVTSPGKTAHYEMGRDGGWDAKAETLN